MPITLKKLDTDTHHLVGYSDVSFGNNRDLSFRIGYIVFWSKNRNSVPIIFKSYTLKRITRFSMAAEVIAFIDLLDVPISLSEDLNAVIGNDVPVKVFTDSRCLFDVISKGSTTSQKEQ